MINRWLLPDIIITVCSVEEKRTNSYHVNKKKNMTLIKIDLPANGLGL